MSTSDFNQLALDSNVSIGQQELTKLRIRVTELEQQIEYYEKRYAEHKDLELHMHNSYASFVNDVNNLKKDLAEYQLRNQELKEENIKMKAMLSGRIDVLLTERQNYLDKTEQLNGQVWFEADPPTTSYMCALTQRYSRIKLTINTDTNTVGKLIPITESRR